MQIISTVLAALSRLFAKRIGQWITSALVFLGLTIGGKKILMEPIIAQVQAVATGLSSSALAWAAFFNIDKGITIILSAYLVRAMMNVARVFLLRRAG